METAIASVAVKTNAQTREAATTTDTAKTCRANEPPPRGSVLACVLQAKLAAAGNRHSKHSGMNDARIGKDRHGRA